MDRINRHWRFLATPNDFLFLNLVEKKILNQEKGRSTFGNKNSNLYLNKFALKIRYMLSRALVQKNKRFDFFFSLHELFLCTYIRFPLSYYLSLLDDNSMFRF